jgi:hypothetical protein
MCVLTAKSKEKCRSWRWRRTDSLRRLIPFLGADVTTVALGADKTVSALLTLVVRAAGLTLANQRACRGCRGGRGGRGGLGRRSSRCGRSSRGLSSRGGRGSSGRRRRRRLDADSVTADETVGTRRARVAAAMSTCEETRAITCCRHALE